MTGAAWPLAEEIARVIVAAAREEGDDPIDIADGDYAPRSRIYAFLALAHQFPGVPRSSVAVKVGGKTPSLQAYARAAVLGRGGLKWFDLDKLSRIRAAAGWAPITSSEAEAATYVIAIDDEEEPPETRDSSGAETAQKPGPETGNAQETRCDSEGAEGPPFADGPVDLPGLPIAARPVDKSAELTLTNEAAKRDIAAAALPIISATTSEVEKVDTPAAEVAEQPKPIAAPVCQPEPPKISDAVRAVAAFHRRRINDAPPAPVASKAVASRPMFSATSGIDLNYRPDPQARARGVEILTASYMGDPGPGRSALAQGKAERQAGAAKR